MEWLEAWRLPLKTLLLPPTSLLLMLALGLLTYRRAWGKVLAWCGCAGLYLLSISASSHWLASSLEAEVPALTARQLLERGAQGLLVLGAEQRYYNPELLGQARLGSMSLQRLSYAVHLHRLSGLPIIVSGGRVEAFDEPLALLGQRWLKEQAGIQALAVETESRTTLENLQLSAPILEAAGIRRVALVTQAFHMPRALFAAHQAGVDALPAATGYLRRSLPEHISAPWYRAWLPKASNFGVNYLLLHERLGQIWYRLRV